MNKPKKKILYLSMYCLLKKKYKNQMYFTKRQLHCEFGKHFLIPKRLRNLEIEELIKLKILKRTDKDKIIFIENPSYEFDVKNFNLMMSK